MIGRILDKLAGRALGDISLGDFTETPVTAQKRQPVEPMRYTDGEEGWCPGHQPLLFWEWVTARELQRMGGWQIPGGRIYLPSGLRFLDWEQLHDHLVRHPSMRQEENGD
ncbi:MAG: hypothetical protein KBG20_22945 [Caldilineaceae bacterium]|nr:hypothetical protein [Caldilineaceae bacterium]